MAHDITARSHAAPIQAFGESSPPSTAFGTGAGNLGRLEFLEYTSCSICGDDFYSDTAPPKTFWMMSCGHVLCSQSEHNHVPGRCTKCGKVGVEAYPIDDKLRPELHQWFYSAEEQIKSTTEVIEQSLQSAKEGSLAVLRFQNEAMRSLIFNLRAEVRKLKTVLSGLAPQVEALQVEGSRQVARIKELEGAVKALESQLEANAGHGSIRPRNIPSYLPSVLEDDEGERGDDSTHHIDRYTTPRPGITHNRLTLPPPPVSGPEAADHHFGPAPRSSRAALSKFRYSDRGLPETPHSHPYTRPSSSMDRALFQPVAGQADRPQSAAGSFRGREALSSPVPHGNRHHQSASSFLDKFRARDTMNQTLKLDSRPDSYVTPQRATLQGQQDPASAPPNRAFQMSNAPGPARASI